MEEELSNSDTTVATGISGLLICVVEKPGALGAIGVPVLLLVFSSALAYGALGETGLSLVWMGLQGEGLFTCSVALIILAAVGQLAADVAVWWAEVEGVAAGLVATTAGATVSAVISTIVAAVKARRIREGVETAIQHFSALITLTEGWRLLTDMGISVETLTVGVVMAALMEAAVSTSPFSFLAGAGLGFYMNVSKRRNRRSEGRNRAEDEDEPEMNDEGGKKKRKRKKSNNTHL